MTELGQDDAESPRCWLNRLEAIDLETLTLAQRRGLAASLAEARRLLQEEQQKWRWEQRT